MRRSIIIEIIMGKRRIRCIGNRRNNVKWISNDFVQVGSPLRRPSTSLRRPTISIPVGTCQMRLIFQLRFGLLRLGLLVELFCRMRLIQAIFRILGRLRTWQRLLTCLRKLAAHIRVGSTWQRPPTCLRKLAVSTRTEAPWQRLSTYLHRSAAHIRAEAPW